MARWAGSGTKPHPSTSFLECNLLSIREFRLEDSLRAGLPTGAAAIDLAAGWPELEKTAKSAVAVPLLASPCSRATDIKPSQGRQAVAHDAPHPAFSAAIRSE